MSIELITQNDKACMGVELDQSRNVFNEVSFCPGIGNGRGNEFARSKVDIASQDLCAVSDVVELSAFDFVWLSGQGFAIPFKGLYPGFLIDTHNVDAPSIVVLRFIMQFADVCDLFGKLIPISNVGMFPIPASVRL
jgi:hypothetical protein